MIRSKVFVIQNLDMGYMYMDPQPLQCWKYDLSLLIQLCVRQLSCGTKGNNYSDQFLLVSGNELYVTMHF